MTEVQGIALIMLLGSLELLSLPIFLLLFYGG